MIDFDQTNPLAAFKNLALKRPGGRLQGAARCLVSPGAHTGWSTALLASSPSGRLRRHTCLLANPG